MKTLPPQVPKTLPKELHRFFWDVDAARLNPSTHPQYVINRLLDKGDLTAAKWVLRNFSSDTITETLKKRRDFSPWNGTFWACYFGIPREEVACLHPSYRRMRKQLWPH